ncbi:Extracellular endo-alpha-(1-_5)-L-arabinanase 1 [Fusarium oxysporum f. sp. albedinis]|nr:Extracellular endo-alpha-(1->5)-L-arabinanase 1 [Fusarium oxysporum f. sp. albedinis]
MLPFSSLCHAISCHHFVLNHQSTLLPIMGVARRYTEPSHYLAYVKSVSSRSRATLTNNFYLYQAQSQISDRIAE